MKDTFEELLIEKMPTAASEAKLDLLSVLDGSISGKALLTLECPKTKLNII